MTKLNEKQERFCQEYIIDLNATQAAIRAGYAERTAYSQGQRLLKHVEIQNRIQALMQERSKRTEITADDVLQYWHDVATADPNEIIHLRRVCCRHCFGVGHQYQWRDDEEYVQAVQAVTKLAKVEGKEPVIPSDAGGYGFDPLLRPHPKCPYCQGEGHAELHVEDTRFLSPKTKRLYAGIKQTQAGIEIKLKDQDKAWENIAKHLGMFVDRHELTGKDGAPVQFGVIALPEVDDSA